MKQTIHWKLFGILIILCGIAGCGDQLFVPNNFFTIQDAINFAQPGDVVVIQNGTYSPTTNGESFPIFMKNGVTLQGQDAHQTIIDAQGSSHALDLFNYNNGTISNFTITNGNDTQGAGVFAQNSSATLQNLFIIGNRASQSGSGIYVKNSNGLTMTNLVVAGNASTGSSTSQPAQVEIDGTAVTFNNNVVASGDSDGLRLNFGSKGTFENNIFFDNGFASNGVGFSDTDTTTAANILYNISFGNAAADFFLNGADQTAQQANDLFPTDQIANNFSEDPLFNDPNADDFTLQNGSPARNAGDPNPAFNNPNGTRNDIGAFGGPQAESH